MGFLGSPPNWAAVPLKEWWIQGKEGGLCHLSGSLGLYPFKPLQVEENNFLKRLLCLPVSASTLVVHREAGLLYLEDLISVRPLLL